MYKKLGKIEKVKFGWGGYQDAQLGIWFSLGCVGDGRGVWQGEPMKGAKWTVEDKKKEFGEIMYYIENLMVQAKVSDISQLMGVPIEMTFTREFGKLESWRILEEVL